MFQIGIVDDDVRSRELLTRHLGRYRSEHGVDLAVRLFGDGAQLTQAYRPELDVLFLDVEMPGVGGFDAARAVRELDERVLIVFITRLAQFAIRGYEVDALNYLVKPVPYVAFARELSRGLDRLRRSGPSEDLMLPTARGTARVDPADVVYVRSIRHRLEVHALGREYAFTGALRNVEAEVAGRDFFRVHNSYLVNLRHVVAVQQATCTVAGGDELPVSRARRRAFLEALTDHVGGRAW